MGNQVKNNDKGGERFAGFIIILVILYFSHQSWPAINYFTNPLFIDAFERQGGFWVFVSWVYQFTSMAMIVLTIGLPISIYIGEDSTGAEFDFTSMLLIMWPLLGWYVGDDFDRDDSPLFSFMAFAFITCFLAVMIILEILANISNDESNNDEPPI